VSDLTVVPPESGPPRQFANVPAPQDLYATSDIRIVMIELGKLGAKVDRLIDDAGKHGTRIEGLEKAVDRVRTGALLGGAILSVIAIVFWWAIGDRITNAVRSALAPPAIAETPRAAPPVTPNAKRP
jgi:hypothetical protein